MFSIKFNIDTRDAKSVDDEFGIRTIECYSKSFYTAPPNRYLAYGRHDLQFRKTTGDARKIIAALNKFFKRLHSAVVMERDNDKIKNSVSYHLSMSVGDAVKVLVIDGDIEIVTS